MKYPKKRSYAWVNWVNGIPFWVLLIGLLAFYIFINFTFAEAYLWDKSIQKPPSKEGAVEVLTRLDYYYFTFVTAFTIGYGDYSPITEFGKRTVIVHSIISALYFAIMVSILSTKMLYPSRTIYFSEKIVFNREEGQLSVRFINTHTDCLVNPEVRIFLTEHYSGKGKAKTFNVNKFDAMPFLGEYDFILYFKDLINIGSEKTILISEQMQKALNHNETSKLKSRFKISVSITGNYGIQQMSCFKSYYAKDIEYGQTFEDIDYDYPLKISIKGSYMLIPDFWKDFNKIIK